MVTHHTALSLIIPCYNEGAVIDATLKKLTDFFRERSDLNTEIIAVNDGSTDDTLEILRLWQSYGSLKIISYSENHGKGYAVKQGVLAARNPLVLFTDADLSTPIQELDKLLAGIAEDYDIIIGSRAMKASMIGREQPFYRRFISRVGNLLIRTILKLPYYDTQCGFKLFNNCRELFERQRLTGWSFDYELLYLAEKAGKRVKEVPVSWRHRERSSFQFISDSFKCLYDLCLIKCRS